MKLFAFIGRKIIQTVEQLGEITIFLLSTLRMIFRRPFDWDVFLDQIAKVGFDSLPVSLITAVFTGIVYALSIGITLEAYIEGTSQFMGAIVGLSMARELGPVLTALMITGRVGSAMAAELGTMRVSEQIDALSTLSVDPMKYLVVPRFLAAILMLPGLTLLAIMTGLFGGAIVYKFFLGKALGGYLEQVPKFVGLKDIFGGTFKALVFGGIMATIACYQGFFTSGGAEGVGKSTTRAVVISSISILIADYFFTGIFTAVFWD